MSAHHSHRFGQGKRSSPAGPAPSAGPGQPAGDPALEDGDQCPTGEHEPRLPWEASTAGDREALARSQTYPGDLGFVDVDLLGTTPPLEQLEAPATAVQPLPGFASPPQPATSDRFAEQAGLLESEDISGELESEPTRVEREEDLRAGMDQPSEVEGPRLLVIGGNNRGKEYPLKPADNSLGRGMDNDIILADIAVSRKHTLICYEAGQYVVRDLGSGNGTLLNGQRVDTMALKDGDQLELGNTLLRLVNPHGAQPQIAELKTVVTPRDLAQPPAAGGGGHLASGVPLGDHQAAVPAHATSQVKLPLASLLARLVDTRTKKLAVFGVLGLLALFGLLATIKAVLRAPPTQPPAAIKQTLPPDEIVAQEFNAGITEYNAQRWEQARDHFLKALEIAPNQDYVRQYVDKAKAEISARQALQQAKQQLAAGAFAESRQALGKISTSSTYHREGNGLAQEVDNQEVQALLAQVKALAQEDGKEQQALELLQRVQAISPASSEVRALAAALRDRPKRLKPRDRSTPRRVARVTNDAPSQGPAVSGQAVKTAMARYRQQEWGPAYEAMREQVNQASGRRKQQAKSLADAIRVVGQSWIRAEESADLGQRITYYHKAIQADQQLPGKPHQSALREKLVRTAKAQAATALSRGQYPAAFTAVKLGEKYGGKDDSFRKVLSELERQAQETFTKGYTLRTQNLPQARRLWQQVLRMVPPSSPTYQKAYSWLNNASPSYQDEDEE